MELVVAPVRERGLKLTAGNEWTVSGSGRSRKGAWIEILLPHINIYICKMSLP